MNTTTNNQSDTPETDAAIVVERVIREHGNAITPHVPADFARRLERERDSFARQLRDMTDQFFAVSGQLGEAREKVEAYAQEKIDINHALNETDAVANTEVEQIEWLGAQLARLRAENKALGELLRIAKCPCCDGSGAYPVETGGCDPDGENDTRERHLVQCQWCDERAAHLAQHDSPGAGVKGEKP